IGSECIEIESTTTIRTAGGIRASGGVHRFHVVDADSVEVSRETANGNAAAFPVDPVDRNSGNSLNRFRQVEVREIRDILGADRIHHASFGTLGRERLSQTAAITLYDDFFENVLGFLRLGVSGPRSCQRNYK